jgi:large subunit ribosomal protein L19
MKNKLIQEFEAVQATKNAKRSSFPEIKIGDTVSVKYKITEGATTRLQAFQGIVIAKAKAQDNFAATFTVRKISSGVGVERKFTLSSPLVDSVEVLKRGVVRRAKLYYLRDLTGKASRIKEKLDFSVAKKSSEAETASS